MGVYDDEIANRAEARGDAPETGESAPPSPNAGMPGAVSSSDLSGNALPTPAVAGATFPEDLRISWFWPHLIVFLSFALAYAEVLGASDIFLGVNALDYSGYPDCRPEYIASYQAMANLATKAGVEGKQKLQIHTPLINLTKAQIIARGRELGVDYAVTRSCYDPSPIGEACGRCDSCLLRQKGFRELGLTDPAPYQVDSAA